MARCAKSEISRAAAALAWASCAAACGPAPIALRTPSPPPDSNSAQRVGDGNYYLVGSPQGARGPESVGGQRVRPKVTAEFAGVPTSNDWWSSLIWPFVAGPEAPYSMPLHAHPLVLKAERDGLGVSYPTTPEVGPRHYAYPYEEDLRLGLVDLSVAEARLARYGDWTVTAAWQGPSSELSATFGHRHMISPSDASGSACPAALPSRGFSTGRRRARERRALERWGAGSSPRAGLPASARWGRATRRLPNRSEMSGKGREVAGSRYFGTTLTARQTTPRTRQSGTWSAVSAVKTKSSISIRQSARTRTSTARATWSSSH
jgi:hypothetical protein